MVLDTGCSLDPGRHIHQIRSSGTNGICDIFRCETTRETETKICRSVRQTLPRPREAVAGAGVEKGETHPSEMRDAIPVDSGTDLDPPNHLPPEHFEKRVGFVAVELDPVEPEVFPNLEHLGQRRVKKDPDGCSAPDVADPTRPFRYEHPRRPRSENKPQKVGTGVDGDFGVDGSGDAADLDQHSGPVRTSDRLVLTHVSATTGR